MVEFVEVGWVLLLLDDLVGLVENDVVVDILLGLFVMVGWNYKLYVVFVIINI